MAALTIVRLLFALPLLIILCGNIEINPRSIGSNCKSISICHVNIHSLSRAKRLAIKTSLAGVCDIITDSEIHLHARVPNEIFEIKEFRENIRKDRIGNGGGGAMYINSVSYKTIFKYEKNNLDAVWVQVNTIEGRFLICGCYRPPDCRTFWDDMDSLKCVCFLH